MPSAEYWAKLLHKYFSFVPLFEVSAPVFTRSPFIAGVVLAIMIIPIVTSVAREVFSQTPLDRIQAAYALGATKWSMIRAVVLPFGSSGVVGGAMLGLGRAMGETVAVFTVLNIVFQANFQILLGAGGNVASLIILKFGEASAEEIKALILKEIPHLLGYDKDFFGDESFWQLDGHNTFSELFYALNAFEPGAIIIGIGAVVILLAFDSKKVKSKAWSMYLPGALVVVLFGIFLNKFGLGSLSVHEKHLVVVPALNSWQQLKAVFHSPDWSQLANSKVWIVAITLAIVGSLETLLSVEATDKLDPKKHKTNPHKELKAQGKRVGITFSTFDMLHAGHIAMLSEAKNHCDYLILRAPNRPNYR